ncbi:MAG: response regulator, partial [Proteobacteria bacterium]|nr:response regulator [Pseudomonadota bacterium]
MANDNVWVVDDDRSIRWVLERALEQAGLTTMSFESGDAMLQRLTREQPDVIISDIRMPGIDGIALLERVHKDLPALPIIIMTAHSDLESAVSSYQTGAFDYLPKPFDVDDAMAMVRRAVTHSREQRSEPVADDIQPTEIIGHAPAMQEVFRAIGRLSNSNVTVLINGESGSG